MNIDKEIKLLKEDEKQKEPVSAKGECNQNDSYNWIIPAIAVVFVIKYFATGSGFELGAFAGYWWLIFFLPMILRAVSSDQPTEKSPS